MPGDCRNAATGSVSTACALSVFWPGAVNANRTSIIRSVFSCFIIYKISNHRRY